MNWRLIEPDEKERNQRARQQRKNRGRAWRQWDLVLNSILDPALVACPGIVADHESGELLWSKDLKRPKRLASRVVLIAMASTAPTVHGDSSVTRQIPRPKRLLQKCRRAKVRPLSVPSAAPGDEYLGVDEALDQARELARNGRQPLEIIQFLSREDVTGLSLAASDRMLRAAGIVLEPVPAMALRQLQMAQDFAARLEDARSLLRSLPARQRSRAKAGAWAYFTDSTLTAAMPGLRLPRAFRRDEFFVRVVRDNAGSPTCLDFYSTRFKGLFRHPLS